MLPQQKRSNRIQIQLSHPQSPLLPKKLPPLPQPPQHDSKMIIQMMELHPHPLLLFTDVPHPHPVAVKSLIVFASKRFIVYGLSYVARLVCVSGFEKKFRREDFRRKFR